MQEKRRSKRLDMQAKIILNRLDAKEAKTSAIEVVDLSKFGIGFICEENLDKGAVYETDIQIWTGDIIHAFIEVVRISQQNGGNIYGGIFVGMPESDWCRIQVYETYRDFDPTNNSN